MQFELNPNERGISECRKSGPIWTCVSVHEMALSRGWLLIEQPFYDNSDNADDSAFLQILPQQDPEDNLNYQHLAIISSGKAEFLSHGRLSVLAIRAWKDAKIYFEATSIDNPGSKHLYVADTVQKGNLS